MTKDKLTLILEQVALFRDYSTPEKGMDIATAREEILKLLPEAEKEEDMCKCFSPNSTINEKRNLLWCEDCDKQLGHLTWNTYREQALKNMGG